MSNRIALRADQAASADQPFFGTSENAVKTQIWIVTSIYVIVAIIRKPLNIERSLHTILQILHLTVSEKTPIKSIT